MWLLVKIVTDELEIKKKMDINKRDYISIANNSF